MNELLIKNGKNLLKTGTFMILAKIANDTLKDQSSYTIQSILQDVRRVRTEIQDKRAA